MQFRVSQPPFVRAVGSRCGGFALIITVTMMVLLGLLAMAFLGLAGLTLRATSAGEPQAIARQNARMALIVALGELQKQLGPDQRISAAADLGGKADGTALANGDNPANNLALAGGAKSLTAVQPGTRYWTGVWENGATRDPEIEIYAKPPTPLFRNWLVSGNLGSEGAYTPASNNVAAGGGGQAAEPKAAAILVGPGTVGGTGQEALDRHVTAPLVTVTGASGVPEGRLAWWVGDEGVKARLNMARDDLHREDYAALAASRRGWESVPGFGDYPAGDGQSRLPRITDLPQSALVVAGLTGGGGDSALQAVFHSATADSRGVLADTVAGGMRIDLTAVLSHELPGTNPIPGISNYPAKRSLVLPKEALGRNRMIAPVWDSLKEFYDLSQSLDEGVLDVRPAATPQGTSVSPLITDLRILAGVRFAPAPGNSTSAVKANACGKIALAIANPYAVPLRWKKALEIELRDVTPNGNRPTRIWNLGDNAVFFDRNVPGVFNNLFFRIDPETLQPGECRAYTVAAYTQRPRSSGNQRTVVAMAPFDKAAPFDFTRCIEMDSPATYTSLPSLDVRESWQTSQIMLDMRLAGGSARDQPLLNIVHFDLDNGYFGPNTRNYTIANARRLTEPIPLMCYSFQISQPGVNYLSLMPSGYDWGQRASTMRTFTDFNLRATYYSKPIASYNAPPFFMESNNGFAQLPDTPPGGNTGTAFTKNLASEMPWGRGWTGTRRTVLFSVPRRILSMAQFQHADLTGDDVSASLAHQPGNAFANSYAPPFVTRNVAIQRRTDYQLVGSPNSSGALAVQRNYYDISYLLNTALWDAYFLSTVRQDQPGAAPENPALVHRSPGSASSRLLDPVECATELMIEGAFNVNSTSVEAWKALLASSKGFRHPADSSPADTQDAAFPRQLEYSAGSASQPSGEMEDSFAGYRRLSDEQLQVLAEEIVKQVRLRGPFLSLSQFVNRALADLRRFPVHSRAGALQVALDESGINIDIAGRKNAFRSINPRVDRMNLSEKQGAPRADMDGGDTSDRPADADPRHPDWARTSTDNNFGAVAGIVAEMTMLSTAKQEQGWRSSGIPGWVTQADILQVIGSSLSARSDTFRIRAYGEAVDSEGNAIAKAWCEAIVQREPEYVNPANKASERRDALLSVNRQFGRRFTITNFRWLSPNEI